MYILIQKLKAVKQEWKIWNKRVFGNVHFRVEAAIARVDSIQEQIDQIGFSEALQHQELDAQLELNKALSFQEALWKEKAKMKWYSHGDRNTAFFHKVTKIRHVFKQMSILKCGNAVLDNPQDIERHVVDFYSNLYASNNVCLDNGLVESVIPSLVFETDNNFLTNVPTMVEVKEAVFSLDRNSAPGLDGFGGSFYHTFWDIIGKDVHNSVLHFFVHGWIFPNLKSNVITLIPKFDGADKIEDYRPIAYANFQLKIISKVLGIGCL